MKTKKRRYECLGGPLDGKKVRCGPRFVTPDAVRPLTLHYYALIRLVDKSESREMLFYHYYGTSLPRAVAGGLRMVPRRSKFWPVERS